MSQFKEPIKKFLEDGDAQSLDKDLNDARAIILTAESERKKHNARIVAASERLSEIKAMGTDAELRARAGVPQAEMRELNAEQDEKLTNSQLAHKRELDYAQQEYNNALQESKAAEEDKFGNPLLNELNDAFTEVLTKLPCSTIAERRKILVIATKAREYNANGAIEAILKRSEISQNTVLATALKNLITEQRFDVAKRASIDYNAIKNSVNVHKAEDKWLDKMIEHNSKNYSDIEYDVHDEEQRLIQQELDKQEGLLADNRNNKDIEAKIDILMKRKEHTIQLRSIAVELRHIAIKVTESGEGSQKIKYDKKKKEYDDVLAEYAMKQNARSEKFKLERTDELSKSYERLSEISKEKPTTNEGEIQKEAEYEKERKVYYYLLDKFGEFDHMINLGYGRKIENLRLSDVKLKILEERKKIMGSLRDSAGLLSAIGKRESVLINKACETAGVKRIQELSEDEKISLQQARDLLIQEYNEKKTEYDIALQAYEEAKKAYFGFNKSEHLEELDSVINRGHGQKLKGVFAKMVQVAAMEQRVQSETALRINEQSREDDTKEETTFIKGDRREQEYNIGIEKGEFVKGDGLVDTSSMESHEKKGFAAVVLNARGEISLFNHHGMKPENSGEAFAHSSMNSQADVIFAGEIKIENGKLIAITEHSGHYLPSSMNDYLLLEHFKKSGIDISGAKIYSWRPLTEYSIHKGKYLDFSTNAQAFYKTCTEDFALLRQRIVTDLQNSNDVVIDPPQYKALDRYLAQIQTINNPERLQITDPQLKHTDPGLYASLTRQRGIPELVLAQLKKDIKKLHRKLPKTKELLQEIEISNALDVLSALNIEEWESMLTKPESMQNMFNTQDIKEILNMKDISGNTIVHIAAKKGDTELLRLLTRTSSTARITSNLLLEKNNDGKTPMDYKGGRALVKWRSDMRDNNIRCIKDAMALIEIAAEAEKIETVQVMVSSTLSEINTEDQGQEYLKGVVQELNKFLGLTGSDEIQVSMNGLKDAIEEKFKQKIVKITASQVNEMGTVDAKYQKKIGWWKKFKNSTRKKQISNLQIKVDDFKRSPLDTTTREALFDSILATKAVIRAEKFSFKSSLARVCDDMIKDLTLNKPHDDFCKKYGNIRKMYLRKKWGTAVSAEGAQNISKLQDTFSVIKKLKGKKTIGDRIGLIQEEKQKIEVIIANIEQKNPKSPLKKICNEMIRDLDKIKTSIVLDTTRVELKVVKKILQSGGSLTNNDDLSEKRVDKVMSVLRKCQIVKGQNNKSGDTIEIDGCKIAYAELKQQLYDVVDAAAKMDDPDRKKQISKFLDEFVKQSSDKVLKEKIQGLNPDKHDSLRNQ